MRSGDYYFNTQFDKNKLENKEFRTETEESKKNKETLNEVKLLKDYLSREDFNFKTFQIDLNNITFNSNDFILFDWFFKTQNELLEKQKTNKFSDNLIKNLLLNNLNYTEKKLELEIETMEIWNTI